MCILQIQKKGFKNGMEDTEKASGMISWFGVISFLLVEQL